MGIRMFLRSWPILILLFSACSQFSEAWDAGRESVGWYKQNEKYKKSEKLCQKGDAEACSYVAKEEIEFDRRLSLFYYRRACRLGHETACDNALRLSFQQHEVEEYVDVYDDSCFERGDYHCSVMGRFYFRMGDSDLGLKRWREGCRRRDFNSCLQLAEWAWQKGNKKEALDAIKNACSPNSRKYLPKEEEVDNPKAWKTFNGKLRSCLLTGLWYFERNERELSQKFYSRTCQMASLKGEVRGIKLPHEARLYHMLGCSRAGAMQPIQKKEWLEVGHEYLKSRCLRGHIPEQEQYCYDLAALESVLSRPGPSLRFLQQAVKKGYDNWDYIMEDPEMANMRQHPEFIDFMKKEKKRREEAGKKKAKP